MRVVHGSLLGLVIGGASGCLLFTDTINVPPMIAIDGPTEVRRGRPTMFTINLQNDPPSGVTVDWRKGTACPGSLDQGDSGERASEGTGLSAMVDILTGGPTGCVWAVARDKRGARGLATREVKVVDPRLVISLPEMVVSGQEATFTASYPDEPEVGARFFWGRDPSCTEARRLASTASAAPEVQRVSGKGSYKVERAPRQSFCVAVRGLDDYDVPVMAEVMVEKPLGGDPVIRLAAPDVKGPVPLFSEVQLAAGEEMDFLPEEAVTFNWKLTAPGGATVAGAPCPGVKPLGVKLCFRVPAAGGYRAELSTLEGTVTRAARPFNLLAEDIPPCIRETEPPFDKSPKLLGFIDQPRVFRALEVVDDGDPVPLPAHVSQRRFMWFVRPPGADGFEYLANESFRELIIPAGKYRSLDRIQVRLEYRDRVTLDSPGARDVSHCKSDDPTCATRPGSGCFQWVTWTVDYL